MGNSRSDSLWPDRRAGKAGSIAHYDRLLIAGVLVGIVLAYAVIIVIGLCARRRLGFVDRQRVMWATGRQRPMGRAELAQAQLGLVRCRGDMAERSPLMRKPWTRVVLPLIYAVPALVFALSASLGPQKQQPFAITMAVIYAASGVALSFTLPRSLRQVPAKMAQLRTRIEERYAV